MKRLGQASLMVLLWVGAMAPAVVLFVAKGGDWYLGVARLLLSGAIFLGYFSLFRKVGWGVWLLFPLWVLGSIQLVMVSLLGYLPISVTMFFNTVTTDGGESGELFGTLLPAIGGSLLLFLLLLGIGVFSLRRGDSLSIVWRKGMRWVALLLGVVGGGLLYGGGGKLVSVYPLSICYNLGVALGDLYLTKGYSQEVAHFAFGARATHAPEEREAYLLVIGETSRAASWSHYGYERMTHPHTCGDSTLLWFEDVVCEANVTHKSVPLILSPVTAACFEDIYRSRSLITAFREAGFYTVFLSNQPGKNESLVGEFASEAHRYINPREESEEALLDEVLLPFSRELLASEHEKLLLVIHLYGSHFAYEHRFPSSMARFLPYHVERLEEEQRTALVNGYDNSLLYTDSLLGEWCNQLRSSQRSGALLYLSDHGENLFDKPEGIPLHGSPHPSYYELHIPLLLCFTEEYRNLHSEVVERAYRRQTSPLSTCHIFHTLLELAGIECSFVRSELSFVGEDFQTAPRLFLDDYNRATPLHLLGLDSLDVARFRSLGLALP